jgi:hypothetical protein
MEQSGNGFFDRAIDFRYSRLTNLRWYSGKHHRSSISQNCIHALYFKMMQPEFIMLFHTSYTSIRVMKKRCQIPL